MPPKKDTSWGKVADWYHQHLQRPTGTYHRDVILPNLLRLMAVEKGEVVLDVACGEGFFARELFHAGAKVIGTDLAPELIKIAQKISPKDITYHAAPADRMPFLKDASVDTVLMSLAIQNIEDMRAAFAESHRLLKPGGKIFLVMNHPAFRVPKHSGWGRDGKIQYRRVDKYLSELRVLIQMHPGAAPEQTTLSFHRPLQYYFKMLNKTGFVVSRLEEWISHKKSVKGPHAVAEDTARKEIPLFMCVEGNKVSE